MLQPKLHLFVVPILLMLVKGSFQRDVLFPFAEPDAFYVTPAYNKTSGEISIPVPFLVFGRNHSSVFVGINGLISFSGENENFDTRMLPFDTDDPFIAVFWAQSSTYYSGSLSYRPLSRAPTNEILFCQADETIKDVFPSALQFSASWMLVATWHRVPFEEASEEPYEIVNTFQAVLVTNGTQSFAVLNYENVQWTTDNSSPSGGNSSGLGGIPAQVGFDAADGVHFYTLPTSQTDAVVHVDQESNIGIGGRWLFRIDGPEVEVPSLVSSRNASEIAQACDIPGGSQCLGDGDPPECICPSSPPDCTCSAAVFGPDCTNVLLPFGYGDSLLINDDNGSSGEIPIPVAFPFFGRNFSSLFINTNGLITFIEKNTGYTPDRFPLSEDIPSVAVFWGDVDTGEDHYGNILYRNVLRSSTNELIFSQVDDLIRANFPNSSEFSASWMLVATWHKVVFHGADDNEDPAEIYNTFQGVLVTDELQSFAMFNYESITWTTGSSSGGNSLGLGGIPAQVGFDAGDGINFYEVPGSQRDDIVDVDERSNINTRGRWLFRVDTPEIQGPVGITCPSAVEAANVTCRTDTGKVTWSPSEPTAVNLVTNTPLPVTCSIADPDGGSRITVTTNHPFPVGVTTVTCDTSGATCRFDVVVYDNEPPVISRCPCANPVYVSAGTDESRVAWTPAVLAAMDAVDGAVPVVCTIADDEMNTVEVSSNDTFAVGLTTVTCLAVDAAGNNAICQFNVTVTDSTPPDDANQTACPSDSPTEDPPGPVLFPFAEPDAFYVGPYDDISSGEISINVSFPFFGRSLSSFYVSNHGLISFTREIEDFDIETIPYTTGDPFVAVFWAESSTYYYGSVSYRQHLRASGNEVFFCQAEAQIKEVFPSAYQFSASWMLVVTWHGLPFERNDDDDEVTNTFQAALMTDGTQSFALFNYEDIRWTTDNSNPSGGNSSGLGGIPAQIGFDAADGVHFYTLPKSQTDAIVHVDRESNIGIEGRWLFQVDGPEIEVPCLDSGRSANEIAQSCNVPDASQCLGDGDPPECICPSSPPDCTCSAAVFGPDCTNILLPFGYGDSLLINYDDETSGDIPIPVAFPFFGRNFSSLFINTNGLITFIEDNTGYTPDRFPLSEDIPSVAVFWGDVDTGEDHYGNILYRNVLRSSTNELIFSQVDDVIRANFPNTSEFSASWMLVVTWHKVVFHGADDNEDPAAIYNTFQGVLVTDELQSFAMFNYENITWTTGSSSDGNSLGLGGIPAQVGFDAGDGINYYEVPGSHSDDIVNVDERSNINARGRWLFRVDTAEIFGPVTITCPSAVEAVNVTCRTNTGKVTWTPSEPTALNLVTNTPLPVTCSIADPDGGSRITVTTNHPFPVGETMVICDASGATCRFDVVVYDNEPPLISRCPCANPVYVAAGTDESRVVWTPAEPTAVDAVDGAIPVVCTIDDDEMNTVEVSSNDTFAIGLTTVTCLAMDAAGNTATCQFNITVADSAPPDDAHQTACPSDSSTEDDPRGLVLFPFAEPDAFYVGPYDDISSGEISINVSFPFFGRSLSSFYVSNHGLISFTREIEDFDIETIPYTTGDPFVAVFWAESSTYYYGSVSYRQHLRASGNEVFFCQAEAQIKEVFPSAYQFSASWMLVVTWHGVPFERNDDDDEVTNTFQAALVTDGTQSFALFNYEDIRWTTDNSNPSGGNSSGLGGIPAQIGFDAADGVHFYTLPTSQTDAVVHVDRESNIGIEGRWLFRVDGPEIEVPCLDSGRSANEIAQLCDVPDASQCLSDGDPPECICPSSPPNCTCSAAVFGPDCTNILLPFGYGDSLLINYDDETSGEIPIPVAFPFYGRNFSSLFINTNGLITFIDDNTGYTPNRFPLSEDIPSVAVFWGDVDTGEDHYGNILYRNVLRSSTNELIFSQVDDVIRANFPNASEFSSSWMLVVTWHKVVFHGADDNEDPAAIYNTFQGVLVTDEMQSFAMFNYENITWTTGSSSDGNSLGLGGIPAQVGFDAGDGINYYEVPGSQSDDIVNVDERSNINTRGRWLFRIDTPEIFGSVRITCPSDTDAVNVTSGTDTAAVTWNPSEPIAVNLVTNTQLPVTCSIADPHGGSRITVSTNYPFPVGETTVTCDVPGATCRFDVVVYDNEAPVISRCPCANQTVVAPGTNESRVIWSPEVPLVVDVVEGSVPVICTIWDIEDDSSTVVMSNDSFPLGLTTVTCTATDTAGNSATCQFNVTVTDSDQSDSMNQVDCPTDLFEEMTSTTDAMPTTGLGSSTEPPTEEMTSEANQMSSTGPSSSVESSTEETTSVTNKMSSEGSSSSVASPSEETTSLTSSMGSSSSVASSTEEIATVTDQIISTGSSVETSTEEMTSVTNQMSSTGASSSMESSATEMTSESGQMSSTGPSSSIQSSTGEITSVTNYQALSTGPGSSVESSTEGSQSTESQVPTTDSNIAATTGSPTEKPSTMVVQISSVDPVRSSTEPPSGVSTCSLTCQNGGTLSPDACTCFCPVNWVGSDCSECLLIQSSCQQGTLDVEYCECVCPLTVSGNVCQAPNPCLNGGLCQEGESCVADTSTFLGYRCVCTALEGYYTNFVGSCTRGVAIIFRLRIFGVNDDPVVYIPAYDNPVSTASQSVLLVNQKVVYFILKQHPQTSVVLEVVALSIVGGGSLIVEFAALFSNNIAPSQIPSVGTIQTVLQSTTRLDDGSDNLEVDTQYVTTTQTSTTCPSDYCTNGGTCDVVGLYPVYSFTCRCPNAFTGETCETVIPVIIATTETPSTTTRSASPGPGGLSSVEIALIVFVLIILLLLVVCLVMCFVINSRRRQVGGYFDNGVYKGNYGWTWRSYPIPVFPSALRPSHTVGYAAGPFGTYPSGDEEMRMRQLERFMGNLPYLQAVPVDDIADQAGSNPVSSGHY